MLEHDDLFDLSSLSPRLLSEPDGLFPFFHEHLLAEDMLMLHHDSAALAIPSLLPRMTLEAVGEQKYEMLLNGASLSQPSVCNHRVAFGTERVTDNRIVLLRSIFHPVSDSLLIAVAGPVTAMSFATTEEYLCFGYGDGGVALLQCAAENPNVNYFCNWHTDIIRDCALMSGTYQHQLATGSCDGTVYISDLIQGVPLALMAVGTSVSSVMSHPRHPQVVSCTTDVGAAFVRDIRGQNKYVDVSMVPFSECFDETGGLIDHVWTAEYQCLLAYGNGSMVTVDTRTGRTLSRKHCGMRVESVEYHALSSSLAVFGTKGCSIFRNASGFEQHEQFRYTPSFARAERNSGAFDAEGDLFITAPDCSVVLLRK